MDAFKGWLSDQVSIFLGFDSPEIISYVVDLNEQDAVDYFSTLLDPSNEGAAAFLAELRRRIRLLRGGPPPAAQQQHSQAAPTKAVSSSREASSAADIRSREPVAAKSRAASGVVSQPKSGPAPTATAASDDRRAASKPKPAEAQPAKAVAPAAKAETGAGAVATSSGSSLRHSAGEFKPAAAPVSASAQPPAAAQQQSKATTSSSSGSSLTSRPQPQPSIGPARSCNCMATSHKLLCNCTCCGRIHCEQEADTVCIHCGAALADSSGVSVSAERATLARKRAAATEASQVSLSIGVPLASPNGSSSKRGAASAAAAAAASNEEPSFSSSSLSLAASAAASTGSPVDAGLAAALAHKNKLLQFQATSAQRTRVYDDQADHFSDSTSQWLSPAERAAAAAEVKRQEDAAKERARGGMKISLDFAGRGVMVRDEVKEDEDAVKQGLRRAAFAPPPGLAASSVASTASSTSSIAHNAHEGAPHMARAFANETLSGRAAEVYQYILSEANLGSRSASSGSSSRRMQPRPSHAASLPVDRVQHSFDGGVGYAAASASSDVFEVDISHGDGRVCG